VKQRRRKAILIVCLVTILVGSVISIQGAEPKIRIVQSVDVSKQVHNEEGKLTWAIGDVARVGPGGYAQINYCVTNEDPDFALKGYYVTFILDPELTMGRIDWKKVKEEANGPTGYRWDFGDNIIYGFANTYLLALMGNYARTIYNAFTVKDAKRIDLSVVLAITDEEPEDPTFFSKFIEENIFGVTIQIPDLEPTNRTGRHKWCVEEGFELKWYERLDLSRFPIIVINEEQHSYALPYIVVGNDARIGEEHKIIALVCSADPDSMWQWTSFNVISYEETEFVIEKPQVSQTLAIGLFIAFAVIAWYTKLWKKIGLG